jgi:hypothetical protein
MLEIRTVEVSRSGELDSLQFSERHCVYFINEQVVFSFSIAKTTQKLANDPHFAPPFEIFCLGGINPRPS